MWGELLLPSSCSEVSSTFYLSHSDLSCSSVEVGGEQMDCGVSPRDIQLNVTSPTNRSATAEILLSLKKSFPCCWTGQMSHCNPLLPHARGVGRESCCQCFSPSPLKGIRGTALDAICSAEGRSVCQDLGAAAGLCTEFGPKMARTAVRWDWGTSAGDVGKFWSGASVIYSGLVTSSLSYWTCQRHKNVAVDSLAHPTVFVHLCHKY